MNVLPTTQAITPQPRRAPAVEHGIKHPLKRTIIRQLFIMCTKPLQTIPFKT